MILPAIFCFSITGFAQKTKLVKKAAAREIVFRDPAGLFTIVAPVELESSDNPNNTLLFGGATKTEYFQIIYTQAGSPNSRNANILTEQMAELYENSIFQNGSFISTSRRENVSSYFIEYRQKISKTEYSHTYSRYIVRNGVLYDFLCGSIKPNVKINARVCNNFLYSIKFLN